MNRYAPKLLLKSLLIARLFCINSDSLDREIAVSRRLVNMKYILVTFAALVAVAYSGNSVVEQTERVAFKICDDDRNGCLTWAEVEACEVLTIDQLRFIVIMSHSD